MVSRTIFHSFNNDLLLACNSHGYAKQISTCKHLNWIFANVVNIENVKLLANISYDLTSCNYDDKNIKFLTTTQQYSHTLSMGLSH